MISSLPDNYFYTYVLLSEKDGNWYTGFTINLKSRLEQHSKGKVASTKNRRPLKLIYFEGCQNREDAIRREKYSPREMISNSLK